MIALWGKTKLLVPYPTRYAAPAQASLTLTDPPVHSYF